MENRLLREFYEEYDGRQIQECIQCGTCSASCPLTEEMDYAPRRLFAMAREGFMDEVLGANTFWFCVSCYNCMVRCPKGIKITDLMYGLKKMALKHNVKAAHVKIPGFYSAFKAPVERHGRLTEVSVMEHYVFRQPIDVIKNTPMAMKMLAKHRLEWRVKPLKEARQFKSIMEKARAMEKSS